jgi:hypothetical protein
MRPGRRALTECEERVGFERLRPCSWDRWEVQEPKFVASPGGCKLKSGNESNKRIKGKNLT